MRPENRNQEGECYQVNKKVRAVYHETTHQLESLWVDQKPVQPDQLYTIGVQGYHANNCEANLGVTMDELEQAGRSRIVATCAQDLVLEYLREHQNINEKVTGRLTYIN